MQTVLFEILNFPVRALLGVAEFIGPGTYRELQQFLWRENGNMRYFVGGGLWLLCLFVGGMSAPAKTKQENTKTEGQYDKK
jgi:hypothetical protein